MKQDGLLMSVLDIGGSSAGNRYMKLALRLLRHLATLPYLIASRIKGARVLYMAPDKGKGLIGNILIALVARSLGYGLFLHHHNYSYIGKTAWSMRRLMEAIPVGSTHIFLCEKMAEDFQERYREGWSKGRHRAVVVPNAFVMGKPSDRESIERADGSQTIGHLSNLTLEKGVGRFLELFDMLASGSAIRGLVAGPANTKVTAMLNAAVAAHGGALDWLGPVYGDDKARFYNSIDAFVMPTAYDNEAQPLVLLEALAHGVPIIATDIGCTACDHRNAPGLIAPIETFVADAASWLREQATRQAWHRAERTAAQARFAEAYRQSEAAVERCLILLVEAGQA